MSVLSQFCLARWKSVDSLTPTALVYNLSRFVAAPRSDITTPFIEKHVVLFVSIAVIAS